MPFFRDVASWPRWKNQGQTKTKQSQPCALREFPIPGHNHDNLPAGMEPNDVAELKYAPIASIDAERSFSLFKHIFSDRRHAFTEENLSGAVIASFYYSQIENE